MSEKIYMFGYGSLINRESRTKTAQTGEAIPVILHGIQRYLSIDKDWGLSCVGAQREKEKQTNGVLVEISDIAFEAYGQRESFYQVEFISSSQIEFLGEEEQVKKVFYWQSPEIFSPNREFPICQSYLDVILTGCMEMDDFLENSQNEFLQKFIKTTQGFDGPWKNDRKMPQYSRPLDYKKMDSEILEKIDRWLEPLKNRAERNS